MAETENDTIPPGWHVEIDYTASCWDGEAWHVAAWCRGKCERLVPDA